MTKNAHQRSSYPLLVSNAYLKAVRRHDRTQLVMMNAGISTLTAIELVDTMANIQMLIGPTG